jgi:caffeoyl-CoA O-methyltransferase
MFHAISPDMLARMKWLEMADARDREDGTPRDQRLRQIPIETGRFLAILASIAPDGDIVEIGTSAGYSTLWLTLACEESDRKVITFERDEEKTRIAHETFIAAGVTNRINLVHGDALEHLTGKGSIGFCFLDAEKEDYVAFYDLVVPRLVPGGFLVADNVISHADILGVLITRAEADKRVDSVVVPIGKGELVCRRVP